MGVCPKCSIKLKGDDVALGLEQAFLLCEHACNCSIISIDLDGVDSTYESTPLLTLLQTNTTLDELLNNQQIVLFN